MSMSLYVVLALEALPNSNELNSAAKEINAPIEIQKDIDLNEHKGFLPIKLNGEESGVETYVMPYAEVSDTIPESDKFESKGAIVVQFRWGGDLKEAATAFYTAQTLVTKYNGVAFDPESGVFLEPEQIAQGAQVFASMPQ